MLELILFSLPLAFPMLAALVAIRIITPSWHWAAGLIVLLSGLIIYAWVDRWIRGYDGGAGSALGLAIISLFTTAFVIAAVVFTGGLIWWRSKD